MKKKDKDGLEEHKRWRDKPEVHVLSRQSSWSPTAESTAHRLLMSSEAVAFPVCLHCLADHCHCPLCVPNVC